MNTICILFLNIYYAPGIKYNKTRGVKMNDFKPIKQEKTVISIRLDVSLLKVIDEVSTQTDISRNELIVQCIDYALKNFKTD